jgi:adenylate kinase family enzyme
MKKVIVIGSPGSGKSTFSRKLRDQTGLPLYYLDQMFHRADRTTVSREVFDQSLRDAMAHDTWIIDGNYMRTLEMRLKECDTVFFMNLPVEACLHGAVKRIGHPREDMPWIETEMDPEFRQYIIDFQYDQLPYIKELLGIYQNKQIIIFHDHQEADAYLAARD